MGSQAQESCHITENGITRYTASLPFSTPQHYVTILYAPEYTGQKSMILPTTAVHVSDIPNGTTQKEFHKLLVPHQRLTTFYPMLYKSKL